MEPYTYAIGEFLTVESDIEVFLFDVPPGERVPDPDIVIRETATGDLAAEWTAGRVRITVPSSVPTEKTSSEEPTEFMKVVMSAIECVLQGQEAALAFGGALRTPDGVGVGLFGDSDCGKSTAAFRLARKWGYQLLADDLLICNRGAVYPFPRYVNLPRDVPDVERWLDSIMSGSDRIRRWDDQLDVPRALVSDTVPERVELDYVVLLDPAESQAESAATLAPKAVSTERAFAALTSLNRTHLDGWTGHPTVREHCAVQNGERHEPVREAIAGADAYRISSSKGDLARSIADLVES